MNPQSAKPAKCLRALFKLSFALCVALIPTGCTSLENLNQIQADWDRKHAPGTGIVGSRLPQVVQILATYEATQEQRRIAETRARAVQASMVKKAAATKPRVSRPATASTLNKPVSTAAASTPPPLPERIAVEVPHEGKKGASTVMLWDTASEQLVGNEIYDLSKSPAKGSALALWSGASVQYVGNGG